MCTALHLSEYENAIGVCPNGMPILPRDPIKTDQDHIKWFDGEPMFLCSICRYYRPYRYFNSVRLAQTNAGKCNICLSKGAVRVERKRSTPRLKAIGLDAVLRFYCKLCGHYVTADNMDPSRRELRRALCDRCHWKESTFNIQRQDKYVRPCLLESCATKVTRFGMCSKCRGFSRSPICRACAGGAPPILGRAIHSMPSSMFNLNAAFLLTHLVPKHARASAMPATTVPGSQLKSGHPGWIPLSVDSL